MIGRLICAVRGRHAPGDWSPVSHGMHATCGTCGAEMWRLSSVDERSVAA